MVHKFYEFKVRVVGVRDPVIFRKEDVLSYPLPIGTFYITPETLVTGKVTGYRIDEYNQEFVTEISCSRQLTKSSFNVFKSSMKLINWLL